MSESLGSLRLRPQHRIRKAAEFQECREKGRKVFSKHLICLFHKNHFPHARLGLIVTRKTGSSVIRNRWKRIIRDFFRTHPNEFHDATDYVFVVKSTTKDQPLDDIRIELSGLVGKIKIK
jgi:ribonuclease P protein component